ncbi:MAG: acetate/propionate family kinase, partial [Proteobacteria bacterium]
PLHNPPAIAAVRTAMAELSQVPHVAVFDTAFHGTLPARARQYALPVALARRHGLRRFGFHGISHQHVATSVAAWMRTAPQALRVISCHLGNGASVAAVEYGRSVETSMGMTPLEGLVMGSRPGDIDPGILLKLLDSGEYDAEGLGRLLNNESGLMGLTGTNDMREIERRAAEGDESCRLAINLFTHRLRKYIGAYAAVMGGVDAIAFTGGIGEHSALVRHRVAQRLDFLGATLDEDRNRDVRLGAAAPMALISADHARTRLFVVRADEETTLACAAAALLESRGRTPGPLRVPVAVSARHAHLSQPTIDRLFGLGHRLRERRPLSQPGQFAAQETVTLIGPRGRLERVRLLGPPRERDQVEISRSDEYVLGVDAPVRLSGDLDNTPGITLEGPAGRVTLERGVICARRHIHMHPDDARRFGVRDCDSVQVRIDSEGRDLIFADVTVRVSPDFRLELHLDTDEANAAGLEDGDVVELLRA